MIVYLDESGDTGWKFDKPYRRGGSSRYLTIAMLLVPHGKQYLPKRIIRGLYNRTNTPVRTELKGCNLSGEHRDWFASQTSKMLESNNSIKLCAITVYKERVAEHIRADKNKLYNYMVRLCLLEKIRNEDYVDFMPDPRSIKVASGNSLVDYLNTVLWMEMGSKTTIRQLNTPSDKNLNIQFVDIVSNVFWRHHEFRDNSSYYSTLYRCTEYHKLYFP